MLKPPGRASLAFFLFIGFILFGNADKRIIDFTRAYSRPLGCIHKSIKGEGMKVRLTSSFDLSDERPESFNGQPVLVNRATGKASGPGDFIEPYPFWGFKPAVVHVTRMRNMKKHTDKEMEFIKRF
jgi:hypothetical protein